MKRVLFIYNPVSGTGVVRKKMFEIVQYYNSNECLVTMCPVLKMNELKPDDFDGYDRVVVSGGDGTLNEVATGLRQGGWPTPVGYIPAGSTNDFGNSSCYFQLQALIAIYKGIGGTPRILFGCTHGSRSDFGTPKGLTCYFFQEALKSADCDKEFHS